MKIKVKIGEDVHEVDASEIELPDNASIVTPDNASSKGYFTQAQLNAKAKEINKDKVAKARRELSADKEFHKEIFSEYGVELDDDGNPTGLKPEVDIEQVKQNLSNKLSKEYEEKINERENRANTYKSKLVEQSILSATKGRWKDEFTSYNDDGRVKPIAVNQFKDLFDVDESGKIALKDSSGDGFEMGPNGQHITPDQYLGNEEKFGGFMIDRTQRGSGFEQGSNGRGRKPIFTEAEISKMSEAQFRENEAAIDEAMADGRIK